MFDLTPEKQATARRIADLYLLALTEGMRKAPDVSHREHLLAVSMILTVVVRLAYAGVRPISSELIAATVDLVELDLFKQLDAECPQHLAADVLPRIAELEVRRTQLDILLGSEPAGTA